MDGKCSRVVGSLARYRLRKIQKSLKTMLNEYYLCSFTQKT